MSDGTSRESIINSGRAVWRNKWMMKKEAWKGFRTRYLLCPQVPGNSDSLKMEFNWKLFACYNLAIMWRTQKVGDASRQGSILEVHFHESKAKKKRYWINYDSDNGNGIL